MMTDERLWQGLNDLVELIFRTNGVTREELERRIEWLEEGGFPPEHARRLVAELIAAGYDGERHS